MSFGPHVRKQRADVALAASTTSQEQMPGEQFDVEMLGNDSRETVEALPHVGRLGEDENPGVRGDRDHDA
ncbi:MAG: hypothetical protein AAGJ40_20205, partial [Planctomycetota bacterium]